MSPETQVFEDHPVNIRLKLSALWVSMLFVFAYVDLFSLYREDFRADIAAGEIAGFAISQTFLTITTLYVVIPSLMVFATLVVPPTANRRLQIGLSALYSITVIGSAVGEWGYFIFGSVVEAALLGAIIYYAWTWPQTSADPA